MIGQALSHYRVLEEIGAGGMGVLYRAHDERLDRDVAVKVLPPGTLTDETSRKRFRKEALLLSRLNHPNIETIHDFDTQDGVDFLVMEYIPGVTLDEQLAKGALSEKEIARLGIQLADGLSAAHEQGVLHRDLKPGNLRVTPDGRLKILDFGLAKLLHPPSETAATESLSETQAGAGTLPYMAPEQLLGEKVDARTDIYGLGAVLYEMATGRRPFPEIQKSRLTDAILHQNPHLPGALNHRISPGLERIIVKALDKDPEHRYQSAKELRVDLARLGAGASIAVPSTRVEADESAAAAASATTPAAIATPGPTRRKQTILWSLTGLLVGAIVAGSTVWKFSVPHSQTPKPITRLVMALSPGGQPWPQNNPGIVLSPDGTHHAYVGYRGGVRQLFVRTMNEFEAASIPDTENAVGPFFSPNGQWIGFFANGKLKKVSLGGGAPLTLCDAPDPQGGSWGPDDTILFAPTCCTGISRIPDAGGTPRILTVLNLQKGEAAHVWPEILPGGQVVLFTVLARLRPQNDIAVQSLETGERRVVLEGVDYARYAPTGHLVYLQGNSLMAVPFDIRRLQLTGSPVPVLEGVRQFAFSSEGSLVYVPGNARAPENTLVWVDRKGRPQRLTDTPRAFERPRLSPDGRNVAVNIQGSNLDVWIYGVGHNAVTRLTFEGNSQSPIWTPDGKRVTFGLSKKGAMNLFWKLADGSGAEERLTESEWNQWPTSWSPDGRTLAFEEVRTDTGYDIWVLPLEGERTPRPFEKTASSEWGAVFSPDGHWLAYVSTESGLPEIYVKPFPGPGGKWQVSTDGGLGPLWARKGLQLFYRSFNHKMMAVTIKTKPAFSAANPTEVFDDYYAGSNFASPNYDVTPDGQRFLMVTPSGKEPDVTQQVSVVLNWFEELERRVPGKN